MRQQRGPLLAARVAEDRRGRDPGRPGDVVDRGAVDAALLEEREGRVGDLALGLVASAILQALGHPGQRRGIASHRCRVGSDCHRPVPRRRPCAPPHRPPPRPSRRPSPRPPPCGGDRLIALLVGSAFVVILNETIMSVALPELMAEFDVAGDDGPVADHGVPAHDGRRHPGDRLPADALHAAPGVRRRDGRRSPSGRLLAGARAELRGPGRGSGRSRRSAPR